jgi:hypothetical protein
LTISSSTWTGVRCGLRNGRRERGSNPASPSTRYRCTSVITQRRETPYWRATSLLLRRSTTTAATTNCAMPIVHSLAQGVNNVPRQL